MKNGGEEVLLILLADINIVASCEPGGVSEAAIISLLVHLRTWKQNLVSSFASWNISWPC